MTHAGTGAARIGTVVADHPGVVVARTGIGGTRVVDLPLAEQLPRICRVALAPRWWQFDR